MWNLIRTAVICIAALLLQDSHIYLVSAAGLHTQAAQISVELGDTKVLSCDATLAPADTLVFSIHGSTALVVNTQDLNDPIKLPLYRGDIGIFNVEYGEITTNVERRVTISFNIDSVQQSAGGVYMCQYTGNVSEEVKQTLQVIGPPYELVITSNSEGVNLTQQTVFERNKYPLSQAVWTAAVNVDILIPFELNTVVSANPPAAVTWSRNENHYGNSKLDVERNEEDLDQSEFFCSAANRYGSYNVTVIIMTKYKPRKPTVISRDMYPEEGKELIAQCIFDAKPAATVEYVKVVDEGTDTWERVTEREQDGKLIIDDVELDRDVGKYLCTGYNTLGQTTEELFIHGKPKDVEAVVTGVYGDSAALRLEAFSAIPVKFDLYVNNTEMDSTERFMYQKIDSRAEQTVPHIKLPYTLLGLEPLTEYEVQLRAINRHGMASSQIFNITTKAADVSRPPPPPKIVQKTGPTTDYNSAPLASINKLILLLPVVKLLLSL